MKDISPTGTNKNNNCMGGIKKKKTALLVSVVISVAEVDELSEPEIIDLAGSDGISISVFGIQATTTSCLNPHTCLSH